MKWQGVDDNDITFLYGGQPQIEAHAKASEMLWMLWMSRHRFTRLLTIDTQSVSQSVSTCQLVAVKRPSFFVSLSWDRPSWPMIVSYLPHLIIQSYPWPIPTTFCHAHLKTCIQLPHFTSDDIAAIRHFPIPTLHNRFCLHIPKFSLTIFSSTWNASLAETGSGV